MKSGLFFHLAQVPGIQHRWCRIAIPSARRQHRPRASRPAGLTSALVPTVSFGVSKERSTKPLEVFSWKEILMLLTRVFFTSTSPLLLSVYHEYLLHTTSDYSCSYLFKICCIAFKLCNQRLNDITKLLFCHFKISSIRVLPSVSP